MVANKKNAEHGKAILRGVNTLPAMVHRQYIYTFIDGNNAKALSKYKTSLITIQNVCALIVSLFCHPSLQPKCSWQQVCIIWPSARLSHDDMFMSPAHDMMVSSSRMKGVIAEEKNKNLQKLMEGEGWSHRLLIDSLATEHLSCNL